MFHQKYIQDTKSQTSDSFTSKLQRLHRWSLEMDK